MMVTIFSLEAAVDSATGEAVWVPYPLEVREGEPEEILAALAEESQCSVEKYMDDVRDYLKALHGMDLDPVEGETERERALAFLKSLERHGLVRME